MERLPFTIDRQLVLASASFFALGLLARGFFLSSKKALVIASPRQTLLPLLSTEERSKLAYPPDALPGARDVESPYGTIRVYEWGPEDGLKVLLVHGISTPCLALGAVAHGLVEKGCRVILFDLFGRGFSDAPGNVQHDLRLFSTQILLAVTSSPLSWTGESSGKFSMVGYSLGGGISVGFTSYFPNLVNSLVLIAPSGLIRPHNFSNSSRIIYSEGIVPETILNTLVRRRLKTPLYPPKEQPEENKPISAADAVGAEVNIESNARVSLSKSHPDITIERAVAHQVDIHEGFIQAFMSSIRYGPIQNQHERWQRMAEAMTERNMSTGGTEKVLIIVGERDPIIKRDELEQDATALLGTNVEFRFMDAGHEAPITQGDKVARHIADHWGL